MAKPKPDQLPAELGERLKDIRPARRKYGERAKPPPNFHETLLEAALVCPTWADLAAFYWVSEPVLAEWRKADATIDVVVAQARQADAQEVLSAIRDKAVRNRDPSAARLYLQATRPELVGADVQVNVDNRQTKITVLPPPAAAKDWKPPVTVEGESVEVEVREPDLPLRILKDVSVPPTPDADPATGKRDPAAAKHGSVTTGKVHR